MKLEICYTFQEDKSSPIQTSWTYFDTNVSDLAKATKKAGTYFKTFVRENGYGKQVNLTQITVLKNATTPTTHIVVPAPKRKRTSKSSTSSRTKSKK